MKRGVEKLKSASRQFTDENICTNDLMLDKCNYRAQQSEHPVALRDSRNINPPLFSWYSDAAPTDMNRYDQAANDPQRDPDYDPVKRYARHWLMLTTVISAVLVVAVLLHVQSL